MAASECIHTHMQLYLSAQILMSFSHSIIPVSYTHLDVYKRQLLSSVIESQPPTKKHCGLYYTSVGKNIVKFNFAL